MYQVLARKWRPKDFAAVIGQEHVVRALVNALTQQRLHHAYLLTGTRGVGKTTIARILAKCFNCATGVTATPCGQCDACIAIDKGICLDLMEVDAASRTKVEDTRDLLDNVQYLPVSVRYKVYIIDEVHMLSGHSFNALLKTLEEPPAHVKFLLATTDPQKLPITVLSRCLQFNLKKLSPTYIHQQLRKILCAENIAYEDAGLLRLASAADGSVRDALSLLDQAIAYGGGEVKNDDVCSMLGVVAKTYIVQLLEELAHGNVNGVLGIVAELDAQAKDFNNVAEELLNCLHQIAMLQMLSTATTSGVTATTSVTGATVAPTTAMTAAINFNADYALEDGDILRQLAQSFTPEDVQLYYQIGVIGKRDLSLAPTLKVGFEMLMLRMLAFIPQSLISPNDATLAPSSASPSPVNTSSARPSSASSPSFSVSSSSSARQSSTSASASYPLPQSFTNTQELLTQLKISGSTAALLQHCALTHTSDDEMTFLLQQKHAPLLNKKHEERLQQSLQELFGKSLRVTINVANNDNDNLSNLSNLTPAEIQERKHAELLRILEEKPQIKKILQTFDGTIIPDTVRVDNGS